MSYFQNKTESYILTKSGIRFHPFKPKTTEIYIEDIAHALSQNCRFNGHTRQFYSVAQHSVYVSMLCPPEAKLWGLLHDAAEAYVADLATPIKSFMPDYKEMDDRISEKVIERFDVPINDEIHRTVKNADAWMLVQEADQLLPEDAAFKEIERGMEKVVYLSRFQKMVINECWSPSYAREAFLNQYGIVKNGTQSNKTRRSI